MLGAGYDAVLIASSGYGVARLSNDADSECPANAAVCGGFV